MTQQTVVMPDTLLKVSSDFFVRFLLALNEEQKQYCETLFADEKLVSQIRTVVAVSHFLEQLWLEKPAILVNLLQDKNTWQDVREPDFYLNLSAMHCDNEEALEKLLREYRQQQMSRFIFRDIHRLCTTEQLIRELSWFADACIQKTVDWNYNDLVEKHGVPVAESDGSALPFVVLGMGKLGAHELNLSSDIDLIFAYPESGATNGKKSIDNQAFFTRLGQRVVKNLDKVTIDGFVFRVDMRLRPYGQSGALVLNFDAMELYYEEQGREWERYAMIKARCVAGSQAAGAQLLKRLRPFVYRKYTDFSAIQALRDMKELISREVRRLGKQDDVKLGAGGIREIEFIAQSYQIIYGGRDEELQERSVLKILPYLGLRGLLPEGAAESLMASYIFLRNAEHIIQAIDDEQTQRLPVDENKQLRMAYGLGYQCWNDFLVDLEHYRQSVRRYFADVIADDTSEQKEDRVQWRDIWFETDELVIDVRLKEQGFTSEEVNKLLEFKKHSKLDQLAPISLERLNSFMPILLQRFALVNDRGDAISALLSFVEAVLRRTSYLVLFIENPKAIERLIVVAKASQWIMQQLVQHPVLLDELITAEGLGRVPENKELRELLRQQSLRLNIDDVEGHMDMLRYFRLAHQLHIIAAEASGKLPLMKVSDYLSFLADAVLSYVLELAWLQLVEKHGYPSNHGEPAAKADFAIIAYGKLGGLELSHSSDLDLVFLYETDENGYTDGEKPIDNRVFFTRLGQRIIHVLTALTTLGRLYEVDMRLRPSGAKGLLVSTVPAFEKYQQEEAWTWEHQALVRARPIAGSAELIEKFQEIRQKTLNKQRDITHLRQEVVEMRNKMADNLTPANAKGENATVFHLKHSRGGIVDIEFMVQFSVLAWGIKSADITRYTDNIRILEALAKHGLLSAEDAQTLMDAYRAYRSEGHKLALLQAKSEVPATLFTEERAAVQRIWAKLLASNIENLN
jgi:[glutamine synthetase] adenylyltransferase / [glutamine synthetase]-adenylyl-L-tyrosine phosphorylase